MPDMKMTVTSAFFTAMQDLVGEDGTPLRLAISIHGRNFVERARPIVGRVGDVPVVGIAIVEEGTTLLGFLPEVPPAGAKLHLRYLDEPEVQTDVEYQPLIA